MATPNGGTAFEPSFIARAAGAVRYLLTGKTGKAADGFFGPNQPLPPVAQELAAGRAFDFPTGYNLQTRPRAGEAVDFGTLRALADNYDLLRIAIETRKDQMGKLQWAIVRRDGKDAENDPIAQQITEFLQEPDGEHDYITWKRMLLEDLLVIDAPTCYIRPTLGGQPFAFEPIDGATIKRNIDGSGRTPMPPDPAYQQIIKGLPAVDYHRDELVYFPRNQRTHKVYGYSPVEQIIMTVNVGLRREIAQLEYYTAGNIPDVFIAVPETWNPDQIKIFQQYWDEILAGDSAARRRARFIPGGMDPKPMREGATLVDVFDEWLARVVCYAFSLPPTAFVKQMNRATSENAQEVALEEGLAPLMEWDVAFMNRLIRLGWKTRDYVFAYQDEQDIDPQVQAEIDVAYTGGPTGTGPKIRSIQEVRDDHGWGPLPADLKAEQDQKQEMAAVALEAAKNPQPAVDPKQEQEKQQTKQTTEKIAGSLEQVVDRLGKLEEHAAAPVPEPKPTTSPAQDYAALVEHGVPPNAALKLAGIDTAPIADGDTSLVKATLVPLSVATDPSALAPVPAKPVEKLEKKAAPLPPIAVKAGDTTIHLTMQPPAPAVSAMKRTVQFKKNEVGDLESAEITDEEVPHGE